MRKYIIGSLWGTVSVGSLWITCATVKEAHVDAGDVATTILKRTTLYIFATPWGVIGSYSFYKCIKSFIRK